MRSTELCAALLLVAMRVYDVRSSERDWYKLTLPGTLNYPLFSRPARDPLTCWPDVYEPTMDTPAWERVLTNWSSIQGYRSNVKLDTGFDQATINYAFNNLIDYIPTSNIGGVNPHTHPHPRPHPHPHPQPHP